MTVVPLPDTPCVRVRLVWQEAALGEGSTRFYLSYSGSAPSGANCTTLAGDIEAAWAAHLVSLVSTGDNLNEVDVIDIATHSGASGSWTGATPGTNGSNVIAAQCAMNIEYDIARRYRGGKPRGFWPFALITGQQDQSHFTSAWISSTNTAIAAFFAAVEALSVGSMGTLQHVNLSYFSGFTNHTNTSGRTKPVPTYRATALHDNVEGYAAKVVIGSQKRRRTSTTP